MLPNRYQVAGESVVATYNAVDVIRGTGYVTFYAGGTAASGAIVHRLSNIEFNCSTTAITSGSVPTSQRYTASTTNTTMALLSTINFISSSVNRPLIVQGDMLCNIPIACQGTGTRTGACYVTVNFIKTSGGSDTTIASATSAQLDIQAEPVEWYFSFPVTIPITKFKIGDNIKIQVLFYGARASGTGVEVYTIGHDPMNEAVTAVAGSVAPFAAGNSQCTFQIPFKIDI